MGEEVFIDANIFLEIFLDQQNADDCERFLRSSDKEGKSIATSDFVVYSCLVAIQRSLRSIKPMRDAIIFFTNNPNLRIIRPSLEDIYHATKIMEKTRLDFDDSLIVSCMENNKIKKIASLDRHFDKVKSIERIKL